MNSLRIYNAACEVYFSPKGDCTGAFIRHINAAQHTVRGAIFTFTSASIAAAMIAAKKRNVDVQIIVDRNWMTNPNGLAAAMIAAGIPIWVDMRHLLMHNKYLLIDSVWLLTGSFNWTETAETSNAENLIVLSYAHLAAIYVSNWYEHQSHCAAYGSWEVEEAEQHLHIMDRAHVHRVTP